MSNKVLIKEIINLHCINQIENFFNKLNQGQLATKKDCLSVIMYIKHFAIDTLTELNQHKQSIRLANHNVNKINYASDTKINVSFIELDNRIKDLQSYLIDMGEMLQTIMIIWQQYGAELKDLYNICNITSQMRASNPKRYKDIYDMINDDNLSLFDVLAIEYLDDKSNSDFLEDNENNIFSVITKYHMINKLKTDKMAQKSAEDVIKSMFLDLPHQHYYIDDDGTPHLIDE